MIRDIDIEIRPLAWPLVWERCDDCPKNAIREDDCYPCPMVERETDVDIMENNNETTR